MKWFNHIVIAGSTTAVIAPELVPVAILGSTAPDWIEWILKAVGNPVKHRTVTHIVMYWVLLSLFGLVIWDWHGIVSAFAYGGLTHVIADSLTIMGVPFTPFSDRRFNLLGGRLRTGEAGEFLVSGGIGAVCIVVASQLHTASDFFPFFYGWGELYNQGIIDGHEWKTNRFNFI
ncbi:MAG: metal-dependent hydrolase [Methylococcaceae bacterium]